MTNLDLTLTILANATPACVEGALVTSTDGMQKLDDIESTDLDKDGILSMHAITHLFLLEPTSVWLSIASQTLSVLE